MKAFIYFLTLLRMMLRLSKAEVVHYKVVQKQIKSIRKEINGTYFNGLKMYKQKLADINQQSYNKTVEIQNLREQKADYQRELIEHVDLVRKYITKYGILVDDNKATGFDLVDTAKKQLSRLTATLEKQGDYITSLYEELETVKTDNETKSLYINKLLDENSQLKTQSSDKPYDVREQLNEAMLKLSEEVFDLKAHIISKNEYILELEKSLSEIRISTSDKSVSPTTDDILSEPLIEDF